MPLPLLLVTTLWLWLRVHGKHSKPLSCFQCTMHTQHNKQQQQQQLQQLVTVLAVCILLLHVAVSGQTVDLPMCDHSN
jgi:hypothetical protein